VRNLALILIVLCLAAGLQPVRAGDTESIAAINAASAPLDDAFERQSSDDLKHLMTADHVAVTPYYGPRNRCWNRSRRSPS
jgi:hypothetical protein